METLSQENVVLSQNQPILPEQPKQNNFLAILLSVLLLLSVSIAGFFAYQTQALVKELTSLKSSSTPVSSNNLTIDPTAEWKTYINEAKGYSVKYPLDSGLVFLDCSKAANSYSFVLAESENSGCLGQGEGWVINSEGSSDCTSTDSWRSVSEKIKINDIDANKCTQKFIGEQLYPGTLGKINVMLLKNGKTESFDLKDLKYSEIFDQILSTFKFIN